MHVSTLVVKCRQKNPERPQMISTWLCGTPPATPGGLCTNVEPFLEGPTLQSKMHLCQTATRNVFSTAFTDLSQVPMCGGSRNTKKKDRMGSLLMRASSGLCQDSETGPGAPWPPKDDLCRGHITDCTGSIYRCSKSRVFYTGAPQCEASLAPPPRL